MKYFLRYITIGIIYFVVCQYTYLELFVYNDQSTVAVLLEAVVLHSYFWVISWNIVIQSQHKKWLRKHILGRLFEN
jgi:hypothetical protein